MTAPTILQGKVVLVTGGSRGLGRAIAEQFAGAGARVVLCARGAGALRRVAAGIREAGGEAVARAADIRFSREAQAVVQLAVARYGRLDIVINNAGILGPRVDIVDYPPRRWKEVLDINLTGTFHVSREAVRVMQRQGTGCLVMISSSVGRAGRGRWGAYAVSKFGVEGLVQVLAEEVRPYGLTVLSFNPGRTRTRMRAEAYPEEDPRSLPDPAVPAAALLRLVAAASLELSGRALDLADCPASGSSHSLTSLKTK